MNSFKHKTQCWNLKYIGLLVSINLINENTPEMKILGVREIGYMSYDHCRSSLASSCGRLVGVVPRVLSAKISRGNKIRTYTRPDLKAFDEARKGLEKFVDDPELFGPIDYLRNRLE